MKLKALFERTMNSLVTVTRQNFGSGRDDRSNVVQINNVRYIPSVQQGWLEVRCDTASGNDGNAYETVIRFDGVEYVGRDEFNASANDPSMQVVDLTGTDGNLYYARYDNARSLDVQVRCTCEDFRWRFAPYNHGDGSLYGNPPPAYSKKTNRPPVNPSRTPGVCKHLRKLKTALEREDFFNLLLN